MLANKDGMRQILCYIVIHTNLVIYNYISRLQQIDKTETVIEDCLSCELLTPFRIKNGT